MPATEVYPFPTGRDPRTGAVCVIVPRSSALREAPLSWCQRHPLHSARERIDGRTDAQHFVPLADWEAWAPFTMVPAREDEEGRA